MLQFCASQQINDRPFAFKATGIRVYSFEEVLYHVYHYWRESVEELLSDRMIAWVLELGHSYLAARMKELARKEPFTQRVLDFLRLTEYFSKDELTALQASLEAWEMRREWEKLRERGDYFVNRGEPGKAISLYKRALQYEENATLLNNLSVAYMQTGAPKDALSCLIKALRLSPRNFKILLHCIEAAILSGSFDDAVRLLKKAHNSNPSHADISFLTGLMFWEKKDYSAALEYFGKAIEADPGLPYYTYKIVDVHLAMRQYEKALNALESLTNRDVSYYTKASEIYAASGDIPGAIKSMRKAIDASRDKTPDAVLYAKLAGYYRQDYDPRRAEENIQKALSIDPEHDMVRLENARIKKGLGRTREYQSVLTDVLKSFKERYRAN
ncbi:MAG: tetratricopeptide repeat protein [Defluviitaleaceae bacterium]|nr:tetratricopeptide repeat protein [Defluviitaleaceae bacterium]